MNFKINKLHSILLINLFIFSGFKIQAAKKDSLNKQEVTADKERENPAKDSSYIQETFSEERIKEYEKLAEEGELTFQMSLALIYLGPPTSDRLDYKKSKYWLKKAAKNGHGNAYYLLGLQYIIDEENFKKAFTCYNNALDESNYIDEITKSDILYELGEMYLDGLGTAKNYTKAIQKFEEAANLGNAKSQYQLGKIYFEGKITKKDYKKSLYWFDRANNKNSMKL